MHPHKSEAYLDLKIKYLSSILDSTKVMAINEWTSLKAYTSREKDFPFSIQPLKMDLKALPINLKYIFLGKYKTFLIVISFILKGRPRVKIAKNLRCL
jgi:hypothetical protein